VCNNAEITPEGLRGQPTEGALLAAAAKVILFFSRLFENMHTIQRMFEMSFHGGRPIVKSA
jgi:hypothetical protein